MQRLWSFFTFSYAQKLLLVAAMPLVLAMAAIAILVTVQSRELANREIRALESQLIAAKKAELRNYVTQARNGFYFIYGNAAPDDEAAKKRVKQILAAMIYGREGFFFVYDYDGTNLVSPRQTDRIGGNWMDETDAEGTPVVRDLINIARQGDGYLTHLWPKPSTGKDARMISYVTSFPSWQWAVGTGVFIDDVLANIAASRLEVETRVQRTFVYITVITLLALLLVFGSGMVINIRERRLADAKLKRLTQRVFDAQEEERGRVARELHDGISQILVGVRFALDIARRRLKSGKTEMAEESLDQGFDNLATAITEVRRISRDLRPGVLDDLGLGPAVKALTTDFEARTGVKTTFDTVVFRNRLDQNAKIALYRIAQEALTNIERHSGATHVTVDLRGHRRGATLRITDNGCGIARDHRSNQPGIGLRNMQERVEQLDGTLRILSARGKGSSEAGTHGVGTVVEATVPLTHLLPPDPKSGTEAAHTPPLQKRQS
ncbi:cache domain-containing protein [Pseudosulfitobacter sp. DSM 107133]|jgi:two-component system NarL family sensor kinase|uniref:cache domain-containing protein n=1 Tax=Pseudosulfitobacter sp. DSM 107133 TaxID=2883100 RepID=UPI000DF2679D|nr:cache domain-containing protein [Pseudosulfitobacter sp. DSM 107133]UOA27014.1 Signal transduction histidine-protein kinase/phosphatase DegS [Pseudosulfitobacter sp. DSM 107133]